MITAQEMMNEVNNYREENKKILEELYAEVIKKIRNEAKEGHREVEINMWSVGGYIPSYKGKAHYDQYPPDGLQQAIWDRLRNNGFYLYRTTGLDGRDLEWARIVRW